MSVKETHIPGEPGMWVLIFGDMLLFSVYFVIYLVRRLDDPRVFRTSQVTLHQSYGALNTVVLLTSSLFVVLGMRAVNRRDTVLGPRMFNAAIACALAFIGLKIFEYADKFHHHQTPSTNAFYSYFFILTGLHLFHVVLGLGALSFLRVRSGKSEHTEGTFMFMEGSACWWHMVDLVWMILFPLLYLAR